MPVATRSNSVTNSSSVLRAHRNDAENAKEKHPRIPHHNLKERMKNLAMKAAPTHHPSVDLLGGVNSEEAENRNPKGLQTVLPVSARHDWDINLDRLGYSTCQRPAAVKTEHENTTKPLAARRLTMGGVVTRKGLGSIAEHGGDACGGGARIMVYVRLRPISKKERDAGISSCVKIVNRKDVFITEFASETDYLRLKRIRGRHFMFDSAFPDSTSQDEVYNVTTADLVEGVLQGRNGSVFCYGATGAGKTYTMLGTVSNPGVMVLAIKDLFKKIRQRSMDGEHSVHLSYLEVYNETVRDLLSPGRPLVLREDKQGIVAAGLTQYKAFSTEEVMALLQRGNQSRTTEPTRMNETSSRSHAILQVVAEFKYREGSSVFTRHGKLSLIDLAGSERALATDLRTVRSLEGANINRSLLALSSCINALVEGKKHIPYRNSKLTQLLKDSLGGACHTVMIANISPSNQTFGETQNTLHWADRAKEIRTKACTTNDEFSIPENQGDQVKLLLEVQKENQQLRKQLTQFKQKAMTLQNQLLATASASNCPTPMACSPSPSKSQISEINQLKNSVYPGTPESIKKQKPTCDISKTPEDVIRELKRKIRSLEEDNQSMCKEFSMKENKFKASIDDLQREHALQLQKKDEFIRQLCPKSSYQDHKPSFHSEAEETPNFTCPSDKNKSVKATVAISCTSSRPPTDRSRRVASQKPPIPYEASDRKGKRVQSGTEDLRDIRSPKGSYRFQSPAANPGKKRTFDDITNANSPSTLRPRTTRRSQAACDAPSMLLQPGFARHRLTPSK